MPPADHVSDIAHTIQLAVAPVFLLTALGTMLSVFSTRLGRIVDRARVLGDRVLVASTEERSGMLDEIQVLVRRRRVVNGAITSATAAALLVCVLIAVAFVGSILRVPSNRVIAGLFIAAMLAFISALVFFLREILMAVTHVRVHDEHTLRRERPSTE